MIQIDLKVIWYLNRNIKYLNLYGEPYFTFDKKNTKNIRTLTLFKTLSTV